MSYATQTVITFVGNVASSLIGVAGLSLAARTLPGEDFSSLQIFISAAVLLGTFAAVGLPNAIVRIVSLPSRQASGNGIAATAYLWAFVCVTLATLLVVVVVALFPSAVPFQGTIFPDGMSFYMALAVFAFGLSGVNGSVFLGLGRYASLQLFQVAVRCSLVVAVLASAWISAKGRSPEIYASWMLICQLLAAAAILHWTWRYRDISREAFGSLIQMTRQAFTYLASVMPGMFRSEVVVLWVAATSTTAEGATFRVSLQIVGVFLVVLATVQTPYTPRCAALLAEPRYKANFERLFEDITKIQMKIIVPLVIMFWLIGRHAVVLLFGQKYASASDGVSILILYVALSACVGPINNTFIAAGMATQKLVAELVSFVVAAAGLLIVWRHGSAHLGAIVVCLAWLAWFVVAYALLVKFGIYIPKGVDFRKRILLMASLTVGTIGITEAVVNLTSNVYVLFGLLICAYGGWCVFVMRTGQFELSGERAPKGKASFGFRP